LDVSVSDMVANTAVQSFAVTRDSTPPGLPTLTLSDQTTALTTYAIAMIVDATIDNDSDAAAWILSEAHSTQPASDDTAWVGAEPTSCTFLTATEEVKTVYVWTMDAVGNVSANPVSHDIELDTTVPDQPVVSGKATTSDTTPTWTWTQGASAGNGSFQYQLDSGAWTPTTQLVYTPATDLARGAHTLNVQERDDAGNWSLSGVFAISVVAPAGDGGGCSGTGRSGSPLALVLPLVLLAFLKRRRRTIDILGRRH
jgi:MYXO-CTERM domain-containing protein